MAPKALSVVKAQSLNSNRNFVITDYTFANKSF